MVFEDRYKAADQIAENGSQDPRIQGNEAVICGVKTLHGAAVQAQELRGGAAADPGSTWGQGSYRTGRIFFCTAWDMSIFARILMRWEQQ